MLNSATIYREKVLEVLHTFVKVTDTTCVCQTYGFLSDVEANEYVKRLPQDYYILDNRTGKNYFVRDFQKQNSAALELARLVLSLNPACPEIGPGMLAQLQSLAKRITQ